MHEPIHPLPVAQALVQARRTGQPALAAAHLPTDAAEAMPCRTRSAGE